MNRFSINKFSLALSPFIVTLLVALVFLSASRLLLGIWHFDRVVNADGWSEIILSGLRIDIATLSYLFIIPALITCLGINQKYFNRAWNFIIRVWATVSLWLLVFMEIITPSFILEYDVRPNRLFIEYLIYPSELSKMLISGYKTEVLISLIVSSLTVYFAWNYSVIFTKNKISLPVYWRPLLLVFVLLLGVMGARSSLGHRPLNPAMVAFSIDPLINDLTLNSTYSMLFAVKQLKAEDDAFKYYEFMANEQIIAKVRESTNLHINTYHSCLLYTSPSPRD